MLRRLLLCAVIFVSAASVRAQSCSTVWPGYFGGKVTCDLVNGLCPVGQPVKFELHSFSPSAPVSCVSKVVWKFADGDVVVTPYAPYQRTLPGGRYQVPVEVFNADYGSTNLFPGSVNFTVGRGGVSVDRAASSFTEGSPVRLDIARSNGETATTIQWIISDTTGGTTPSADFSPASGSVTLPAGQVAQQITVIPVDDAVYRGDRTYYARLISATNDYIPNGQDASFTVRENDVAIIDFANRPLTVRENAGVATIGIQRTGVLTSAVSVAFSATYGQNFLPTTGILNFAPGETLKTFNITILNDQEWTGDKSVQIELTNRSEEARLFNNSYWYTTTLTIQEDEPTPKITISDVSIAEGNSGRQTGTFTIKLSPPGPSFYAYYTTVDGTAVDGSDYVISAYFQLNFDRTHTEFKLPFDVLSDTVREAHETFKLRITYVSNQGIALPPDATCTILNDETLLTPATSRIAKGQTQRFSLDIGLPARSALSIPIRVPESSVVTAPAALSFIPGQSTATFEVVGAKTGSARVSAQLPPEQGGNVLESTVTVHDSGTALFEPAAVTAYVGEETTVRVSLNPASAQTQRIPLVIADAKIATVMPEVSIPPGGSATFTVKGIARGGTSLKATLPSEFGGYDVIALVDVLDKPLTPTLASLTPATGPAAGGTAFEARGSQLAADCTLSFGGVPATVLALSATGALTGITPAHAAGTVDVALRCGTSTFTLTNAFTYVASASSIVSITPAFGSTAGGTHVRAAVTNARSGCWMFFGNAAAPYVWINGTSEVTAIAPLHAAAEAVDISLRCGNENATLPRAFSYSSAMEPSMSVLSVDPLSGSPGQSVTISGARFRPTDRIAFDSAPATLLRTKPDAQLVRIPELPPGKSAITLTDAEGRVVTTGPIFTVNETAPPYIGSVTPQTTPANGEVAIDGRGLRPGYSFVVGGFAARVVSLAYERAVLRLTGGIAPGSYSIDVRDASGRLAATGPSLTIVSRGVVLRTITPGCATTDGNAIVMIEGSGFAAGAKASFDGVAAITEFVSESQLRVTTPAGAAGFARVVVTNPNGDSGAISDGFRYRSPFDPATCAARSRSARH